MRIVLVPEPTVRHRLDGWTDDPRVGLTRCGRRFAWGGRADRRLVRSLPDCAGCR